MEAMNSFGSYGYRFSDSKLQKIAQIWSLGWEEQTSSLYDWDGTSRIDTGKFIFQYTISGKGAIEIDGKMHTLAPGQAFIVNIPGNYRYFLPEDSDKWEFIYLTLYGDVVEYYWNMIQDKAGNILYFQPDAVPITELLELLKLASNRNISNAHQASGYAYLFTMELFHYCSTLEQNLTQWPDEMIEAAMYAKNHYAEDIGPDDMAASSGMSRYHFTRQFKKLANQTPIQYLTDIRINKAKELLQNTKYSAEDIAKSIGYRNSNYYNKVFKKVTGMTPGQYKKSIVLKK
ncbi:AraC family transcriptional regulator [Halobacillus andaensis]|uniref:AraC family transcriptional regulator n=1 Tax=Halobacillus andaensis TaxID=1176239 RepID=A0A917B6G0_HALAA|nr:AraC family transcriptional regulator [Halobacillus andaensis]MBP2006114.1 AraC-like DNA-binding protein [Halobacillus andaensis]GGF23563.1 AraC family transcriptional regulator [Halobacillus andaensis]